MLLNNGALVGLGGTGGGAIGGITFFGFTGVPTDAVSYSTPSPIVVTPISSMVSGDLVYMIGLQYSEIGTDNIAISEAGGQSWASTGSQVIHLTGTFPIRTKAFWCQFNGTWDADPSITMPTDDAGRMAYMAVFRPTTGSNTWAVDQAQAAGSAGTTITHTIPAITNTNSSNVAIAVWLNYTTKVYSNLSGTGWVEMGTSQYRNLADNDRTMSFAYRIGTSSGSTGTVSKDTNFNQTTYYVSMSFYESI
jgi:hypothetical protein